MKQTLVLLLLLLLIASLAVMILIRRRQLTTPTSVSLPTIREVLVSPLPSSTPFPPSGDTYSLARLVRGQVLEYHTKNQTLTVIRESLTPTGQSQSQPITLNLHDLTAVTCWTDPIQTTEGKTISVTRAFFPLDERSKLYLAGERTLELIAVLGYLAQEKPYILALLADPNATAEPHAITQLVVVNCP